MYPFSSGRIASFEITLPSSDLAALTKPSVPALNSVDPSGLKAIVRQLPLCRFVRHAVSISPSPLSEAAEAEEVLRKLDRRGKPLCDESPLSTGPGGDGSGDVNSEDAEGSGSLKV